MGVEAREQIPQSMWLAAGFVGLQSFLFGYVFSCLNSCLVTGNNNSGSDCFHNNDSSCPKGTIYNDLNLTTTEASMITSAVVLGAWVGCLIGDKPSERYGRKVTLLGNNLFFIAGAAMSCSGNFYALLFGRLVSGLGVGVASVIPPVLLSEMASAGTRGAITTLHQLLITAAIFFAAIVAYGFVTYVDHGWQYIQAFGALPAMFMLIMHRSIPESPKWLLLQVVKAPTYDSDQSISNVMVNVNAVEENSVNSHISVTAYEKRIVSTVQGLLKRMRLEGYDVDGEIDSLMADIRSETSQSENEVTWAEVFSFKKAMVIGCGLMFFQAMSGINSVVLYSTTIFGLAGFDESIIGTASFGFVNFAMTLVSTYLVDKTGRKMLLTIGTTIMLVSLITLSTVLLSKIDQKVQGLIAVFAVLVYGCGFALGLGAVVWVVMSEIMPNRERVKAVSLFLSINWGSNLIVGLLTLSAIDALGGVKSSMDDDESSEAQKVGVAYVYFIFAGVTFCCLAFLHLVVPETKGKTLEELTGDAYMPLLAENEDNKRVGKCL